MSGREKLTRPMGIRLSASTSRRLSRQAQKTGVEESELARRAIEHELTEHEKEAALREVARLEDAGIDLKSLVDYALAKQAAEAAQASLPGLFAPRERDRR